MGKELKLKCVFGPYTLITFFLFGFGPSVCSMLKKQNKTNRVPRGPIISCHMEPQKKKIKIKKSSYKIIVFKLMFIFIHLIK